jgi:hypothetical protein
MEVSGQLRALAPGKETPVPTGPRAGLDAVNTAKSLAPARNRNPIPQSSPYPGIYRPTFRKVAVIKTQSYS